jgi:hypothetical protein
MGGCWWGLLVIGYWLLVEGSRLGFLEVGDRRLDMGC